MPPTEDSSEGSGLHRGLSCCIRRRRTGFRQGHSRVALFFASRSTLFLGISGTLELKRELLLRKLLLTCVSARSRDFSGNFSKESLFFFAGAFFFSQNVLTKYLVINLVAPITILLVISSHLMWIIFSTFSTLLFRMSPL